MSSTINKLPCNLDFSKEAVWERSYLKKKCKELHLDKHYEQYTRRLRTNLLVIFLFVHLSLNTIKCCMLLFIAAYPSYNYIDVVTLSLGSIFMSMVMGINFNERLVVKHPWITYATSIVGASVMITVDILLHLYHFFVHTRLVLPYYDAYVLYAIYICFPLPKLRPPIILASIISFCYVLCIHLYSFESAVLGVEQNAFLMVAIFHFFCVNMVGIFYRLLSELIVRSSFLDRHQYVMEEVWLRDARKHEKQLLDSILPPDIARPFQEDIRRRIARAGASHIENTAIIMGGIMAIQNHPDVSILFADVVNYTHLTTTLTVKTLVTLLHDLYGRFDHAAASLQVQRIKFLGDCYYCVAGLSLPNPDHATACINMGHSMIAHIREVRLNRNLDIDMRIGVHSGSLMAGVMGAAKLQFDIWGEDVLIAGKLESTGRPGYIHISERTLSMTAHGHIQVLPGTREAREEPFLIHRNIKTFLIRAIVVEIHTKHNPSSAAHPSVRDQQSEKEKALLAEFEKMPLGSFQIDSLSSIWKGKKQKELSNYAVTHRPRLGTFFMHFHDPRIEYNYMRQPDYMLRYSVLLSWLTAIILICIQIVNQNDPKEYVYYVDASLIIWLTLFVFILWYKKLCHWRYAKTRENFSSFSCWLFRMANFLQNSLVCRMLIYTTTIIYFFGLIILVLMDCEYNQYQVMLVDSKLYQYELDRSECFRPWDLTNMAVLMLALAIVFTRIPWMVKIIISFVCAITYMVILFIQYEFVVHDSASTNLYFAAEIAHAFKIVISLASLYFMERQSEFNNKINYHWKLELVKKQHDAVITNKTITILLQNILPTHVVHLYLTNVAKHLLYYENYEMVAVMFASLRQFDMDLANLRLLNEIIIEFDKMLHFYRRDFMVEKIKIVGCTYMAACGLDPRFSHYANADTNTQPSDLNEASRAQRYLAYIHRTCKLDHVENEEVVLVLTTFALDLLRTLWNCGDVYRNIWDRSICNGDMSIGISCGEVMAGVVGASQVHYDIWGNPVNMASRMDATGVSGRIQVTEDVAQILRKFGVECTYRGMTYVKGRGTLPTYFVDIDENYEFSNAVPPSVHVRSTEVSVGSQQSQQ